MSGADESRRAVVLGLHVWRAGDDTPTPVDPMELDIGGPVGDRHHGVTMTADSRQKWLYPLGTEIRNNRQVSLVDAGELALIADKLGVPELAPGTIADNICTEGLLGLTQLAPFTRLVFEQDDGSDGVVLVLGGENMPCTIAGRLVERRYGTAPQAFPKAATHLRGVTGWVERPGRVRIGATLRVVPPRPAGGAPVG